MKARKREKEAGRGRPQGGRTNAAAAREVGSERAEALLLVALDLFAQRDFAAVTIKDIARAAGMNTAMIYYYFQNKEDLFRATIEYATRKALDNYRELRARHRDPVALINDWFDNNALLAEPIRKLVKIMLDYAGGPSRLASIEELIRRFYREEEQLLMRGIRDGIAQGLFAKVEPQPLAAFASVHLDGIMTASMIRRDFDIAAAIATLKHLFWTHLGYPQGGA
jgi:AcrR family transcriptional regulator